MTRPPDDNTPPDAPHAPGTHTDPQRDGSSEAAGEERADSLREPQSYGEAAAWKLVQEVRWQRDERKAGRLVRRDGELTAALERRGEEGHRRLLDILGWESGTEEQTLEALAGAVRAARGDRTHKDVYQQRNEARAECERLRRELRAAREAVGEGWFGVGVSLAQAIKRKVRVLEERLPEDPVLTCARCGPTPHRWRPSPEAGPHWRCSECGEITGPEGGAR